MKILLIGLDAATMDLIQPWAQAGHLPVLAHLMQEGTSARLLSTPNMHSASAWTSILTGLNPGRHGLFVFSDRDFATGEQVFFKGGDRQGDLISSHFAAQNLTSGFVNVPMTYPASHEDGGFVVSGLDAPSLNERAFSPRELRSELLNRFPKYHFSPAGLGDLMRAGRLNEAITAWIDLTETQTAVVEYLIASRSVDFLMTVYTASDWAGHNLWKFVDASAEKNPLLEIYRALDSAVGRLTKLVDPLTQIYVISDHGMGRHTGASYQLGEWLQKKGFMVRTNTPQARRSLVKAGSKAARALLPSSVREQVKARLGEDRVERLQAAEKDSFYSSIDWSQTSAYSEPGRHVININLEGRNERGWIKRSEFADICSRIINELNGWIDDKGIKVVERVAHRDELYTGPFSERASDLYVYWNGLADLGAPPLEVQSRGFWWSGDHRPEGILIAKGPGIKSDARVPPPCVYDLVPTLMHGAELPVPDKLDGRVIRDLFTDEFTAAHPIRFGAEALGGTADKTLLSPEEEQMVEEKLRGLGYI
jgi:predicted AlkP superfamily phosphohydrolase/phosphomutase